MSNYKIVSGRVFQGTETYKAEEWLNANAARGWHFVSALPIVEPGHAFYVFQSSVASDRQAEGVPFAVPAHDDE